MNPDNYVKIFPYLFFFLILLAAVYELFFFRKKLAKKMKELTGSVRGLSEQLENSESERKRMAKILSHMAEGIIAVDSERKILAVNPSAEQMFHRSQNSSAGKGLLEVSGHPTLDKIAEQAIDSQSIIKEEVSLTHLPEPKYLAVTAIGIEKQKEVISAVLVIQDVTQLRKYESHRREFVANVSHELKTPLTSLQGFIETLLGGAIRDETKSESFLKMMEEDAKRLARLVADLLELSKIESNEIPLKCTNLSIPREIENVISLLEPQIKQKNIRCEKSLAQNFPSVEADRDKIKQVLMNLIENAIKFNREGGKIIIRASAQKNKIRVEIEDTGIGIPEADLARVFERFYRVDKARSREAGLPAGVHRTEAGGTGLGLSIAKHIIEAHGGELSCSSSPGQGSSFTFTLPFVIPARS